MNIEDALREYDQKGRGLNVLPASSPAMIAIVEHARLVAKGLQAVRSALEGEPGDVADGFRLAAELLDTRGDTK